ncbi:uncharacterized protein LOC133801872 [Humulus lupulus]|uniref:uncharacterized protein LOC133801872 n=1 Tax=Humulus lupulus TaxID=3486 RepID=UPI002B416158|nr:uncharacterized protein LOC133801872 [Humulus lupulus]
MAENPENVVKRCAYELSSWFSIINNPNPNPKHSKPATDDDQPNHHRQQYHQSFYSDVFFRYLDGDDREFNNDLINQNKEEFYDEDDQDNISNNGGAGLAENDSNDFWVTHQQILLGSLRRSEGVKEYSQMSKTRLCGCGRAKAADFRNCLLREVSIRLRNDSYNSTFCKSNWRCSPDFPSGEHRFVDVVDNSNRKKEVRVIIELNLRTEFDMARASEEYKRLVQLLPEMYVGKVERLEMVIRIMCAAAKKCTRQKKMHLAPWRKHQYIRAKWLSPCKRDTSPSSDPLILFPNNNIRRTNTTITRRTSLLTVDLLDMLPNNNSMH